MRGQWRWRYVRLVRLLICFPSWPAFDRPMNTSSNAGRTRRRHSHIAVPVRRGTKIRSAQTGAAEKVRSIDDCWPRPDFNFCIRLGAPRSKASRTGRRSAAIRARPEHRVWPYKTPRIAQVPSPRPPGLPNSRCLAEDAEKPSSLTRRRAAGGRRGLIIDAGKRIDDGRVASRLGNPHALSRCSGQTSIEGSGQVRDHILVTHTFFVFE